MLTLVTVEYFMKSKWSREATKVGDEESHVFLISKVFEEFSPWTPSRQSQNIDVKFSSLNSILPSNYSQIV